MDINRYVKLNNEALDLSGSLQALDQALKLLNQSGNYVLGRYIDDAVRRTRSQLFQVKHELNSLELLTGRVK